MWRLCGNDASSTPGCVTRLREHLLAHLICPGRHTISGLITVFGGQFRDWSADYQLYSKDRVNEDAIFGQVRKEVESLAPASRPLCVSLDDTILRKTGKTIPGAAYRKDPLGPPFNLNLVWAQRRIQISAALPDENHEVRMIPIGFLDASTPRKPAKTASPEQVELYKERMKQRNLNTLARDALCRLQSDRAAENGGTAPALRLVVDGSYTNKNMLRHLPPNTTLIGRIRKDAKLNAKPDTQAVRGRRRIYGDALPTPEQIRQDPDIPWVTVRVRASGKWRDFEVKALAPVRWRAAGEMDLRLVVIRPIGYRPRKDARKLYTQPAYLICTDPDLPLEDLLQEYIWRWDIEINHRDEKTILGVGQAQVRNENSVENIPATAVAAYAMLHVAAIKAYGPGGKPAVIPEAKWRKSGKKKRPSTQDLINELRRELWSKAIRPGILNDFMNRAHGDTKPHKSEPNLCSTLFSATA
ncbi:MAG: transposase [Verrucomicrobia bacterium]|nr:transposase [Verrucomicrobiota bacterium]